MIKQVLRLNNIFKDFQKLLVLTFKNKFLNNPNKKIPIKPKKSLQKRKMRKSFLQKI